MVISVHILIITEWPADITHQILFTRHRIGVDVSGVMLGKVFITASVDPVINNALGKPAFFRFGSLRHLVTVTAQH